MEDYKDSPVAWFCELETSKGKGDFEQAALAVRELRRLGIIVRFTGSAGKKLVDAKRTLKKNKATVLSGGKDA